MRSERFVVVRVEVEHDAGFDPDVICEEVAVSADSEEGAVVRSKVVAVFPATRRDSPPAVEPPVLPAEGFRTPVEAPPAAPTPPLPPPAPARRDPRSRFLVAALAEYRQPPRPGQPAGGA
jgi:hypothetical protein